MTYPKTESWRDDFDLEPNTHPTIAYALQALRTAHAAQMANARRWPFPTQPIPIDRRRPAPTQPDAEEAPF